MVTGSTCPISAMTTPTPKKTGFFGNAYTGGRPNVFAAVAIEKAKTDVNQLQLGGKCGLLTQARVPYETARDVEANVPALVDAGFTAEAARVARTGTMSHAPRAGAARCR